ncbi:hypothetical protein MF271_00590 (plasmid) [Deinococcus sp. KNUC1210]|uniref:hypothetical protein n=1 Tax=Deinococcus sp. KNUC1210 TaxID=2917691 RepID=UPI001EEFB852|nr:hypothetical protein [Deinococcus sp. KNUC1210]ULH14011.1 hypothetical protein MF271_00590 [Deinococcus sp. KNUC1210]
MPSSAFPTDLQFAEAICRAWDTQDDRELVAFFEQVPLTLLPHFDEWTRREIWHFPAPRPFVTLNSLAPDQSARFLGVPGLVYALACHRNGHVRGDAVSLLARLDTPVALALLLVRVNDWAAPVREQARAALLARLPHIPLTHWLKVAPGVARLIQEVRSPDPALVQQIVAPFLTPDGERVLRAQYLSLAQEVRRALTILLLNMNRQEALPLPMLLLLARDPLPIVRLAAVRALPIAHLSPFLNDRDGAVRIQALRRLLPTLTPEEAAAQCLVALLDPQERVRLLAGYTLRQQGQDVGVVYRQVAPTSLSELQLRGWIAGLASEGQQEDADLIEPFLTHSSARVRLEALYAAGTLDPVRYRAALVAGVLDTSRVSKAALRIMKKAGLLTSPDLLEEMLAQATTPAVRRRVIQLALNLSRFEAAEQLLRWRGGQASGIQGEIDARLVSLLRGYGPTYYARPPAELLAQLRAVSVEAGLELQQVLAAYS